MNQNDEILLVNKSEISRFERGFKSWAENTAVAIRSRLGLSKYAALSPQILAEYLNVRIITPHEVVGLSPETARYLTSSEGDEWSAVTIRNGDINIIVINPSHSERRTANTIMHELSHILRNHKSAQVYMNDTGITFRNFDSLQEAEADWLAGTLLLPRPVLTHCYFKQFSTELACNTYGVSTALFTYRMNISGVSKQFNFKSRSKFR